MNQFGLAVFLMAVNLLIVANVKPAQADWFRRAPREGYNTNVQATPGPAVSREQFRRVTEAGQGVDQNGYYRRPIPVGEAYQTPPADGLHEYPMQWQPDDSILIEVRDGYIIRQDYRLTRSADKGAL